MRGMNYTVHTSGLPHYYLFPPSIIFIITFYLDPFTVYISTAAVIYYILSSITNFNNVYLFLLIVVLDGFMIDNIVLLFILLYDFSQLLD